jgi:hypothetical protein
VPSAISSSSSAAVSFRNGRTLSVAVPHFTDRRRTERGQVAQDQILWGGCGYRQGWLQTQRAFDSLLPATSSATPVMAVR